MKSLFLLIVLFSYSVVFAQNAQELRQRLTTESDRDKIETYLDLSEQPLPNDSVVFYLHEALKTAERINFDSIYPIQFGLSIASYTNGDYVNAKKEIRKAFSKSTFTKHPKTTSGHIYMLLGAFNEALNQIDSAKLFFNKTMDLLENEHATESKKIYASALTNYANLYLKSGEYNDAIALYIKAVKISSEAGDLQNQLITLNNIANCYKELQNNDKALEYFYKALQLSIQSNDFYNESAIHLGIGQILTLGEEYNKALESYKKAKEIIESNDFKIFYPMLYQNLGQTYFFLNDHEKANKYINKALDSVKEQGDEYTLVSILITSGSILVEDHEFDFGIKKINQALKISQSNGYLNLEKECLKAKIETFTKQGVFDSLPIIYDKYIAIKDSILSEKNMTLISNLETKYQTEKKEKENLQLISEKNEQAVQLALESKRKTYYGVALLLSLFLLSGLGYFFSRNKKQKIAIENLHKEMHHRVKNNLAIIDTFIEVTKEKVMGQKEVKQMLGTLQNRIDSIYEVHQQLYLSNDSSNVKLKEYVMGLVKNIQNTFNDHNITVTVDINDATIISSTKSFPVGLIINEFITNSFKYAFDVKNGEIIIQLNEDNINYKLQLSDNGKGLEDGFDYTKSETFGLRIMNLLTTQLDGSFTLTNVNGLSAIVQFPK